MEMIASHQGGLLVAVLIGIAFGFVLERAGFGRADKLAAQFYLRDMRVFKVMFTAIVTAMLGLVIASGIGLVELRAVSESIASFTWIWPMLAGGFLLGIGFIVSGYCPGTSIVATASGNVDGLFTVAGVVTGTYVYTKLLQVPQFAAFHDSGEKGSWFLYDLIEVPPAILASVVAVMAIMAFNGAEKVESLMGGSRTPMRVRRFAFAGVTALAILALFTIAIPATRASATPAPRTVAAHELAQIVVSEPWRVQVTGATATVDGRPRAIAGGIAAWNADPLVRAMKTGALPPSPTPVAIGTVIAKPKKKGGGCSS
jgi:uncharacterized membrane protein YedE/YeeE